VYPDCDNKNLLTFYDYHDNHDYVKQILLRKVPDYLHRLVKIAAAQAGKSMQDWIIEAMTEEVEKGKLKK